MSFFRYLKTIRIIYNDNLKTVNEYNDKAIFRSLLIIAFASFCPVVISIFRSSMQKNVPVYLGLCLCSVFLFFVFHLKVFQRFTLFKMYLLIFIVYDMGLYLSLIAFPNRPAATLLIILCIIPLMFIEKIWRIDLIMIFLFTLHTALSCIIKGSDLGAIDLLNGFTSILLGILFGIGVTNDRLQRIKINSKLKHDSNVDVLTQLNNRRRLYEVMSKIYDGEINFLSAVLMMDIDHFKKFNDNYGHAMGDKCLANLGQLLNLIENKNENEISFYRYGGEEFVAFVWDCNINELKQLAEDIRSNTSALNIDGHNITLSIGAAFCDDKNIKNYETWISRADRATYIAKENGRNQIICWNDLSDTEKTIN